VEDKEETGRGKQDEGEEREEECLNVNEGRVSVDEVSLDEGAEVSQVFGLALVVEPTPTEGQRIVRLVDVRQQLLRAL